MNSDLMRRFDIQVAVIGAIILVFGIVLAVIAIALFKRVKELLAVTSKSERELEEKIASKTKGLSILHELTTVISQSLKVEEILNIALDKVIEITKADMGGIHITDRSGNFLNLAAADKMPAEISMRVKRLKVGEGPLSAAVQKRVVTGIDIAKYPQDEIGALISRHGFRHILSIPLVFKDSALGVITIAYKKPLPVDEEDTLLRSIGMEIGVALNNAMLFEKVANGKKEWESTFDSIEDLVYLHDKGCKIIRCNMSLMKYLKLAPPDIIGKEYFKFFPMTDTQLTACSQSITQGEKKQEEITDKKTGRSFLFGMYPVFDKAGEYIYSVHSAKDITEIKQVKEDLEDLLISTITSLVSAIDAKSPWTKGHSERVTSYATRIGRALRLDESDIETLTLAGLLHDIGKLGTYDAVLDKPDKLTDEEFKLVKKHPSKGVEILAPIKQLKKTIPIIRHHHEKYDGKGYPDGLEGENIPFSARILCIADSFDAMTAERPYKPSREIEEAKAELKKCAGTHFDPKLVEIFINVLENK